MIESLPLILSGGGAGARIANSLVSHTPVVFGDIDNLSQSLTIGGAAYAPNAFLVADDIPAGTGIWPSRHDVSKVVSVTGSGTAPTYDNLSAINNENVKYSAAKYHKAADTTWGQSTTGDWAAELICTKGGSLMSVVSTYDSVTTDVGLDILSSSSSAFTCQFRTAGGSIAVGAATSGSAGDIVHLMFFLDRELKMYSFVNGAFSTSVNAAYNGVLTGLPLSIGARPAGALHYDGSVLLYAAWDLPTRPFPGDATNQAVMGAIAASRFATVSGISCNKSTAYSFVRASSAHLDRYTSASARRLFPVSPGWPRVCQRRGSSGVEEYGYLSEPQGHNDLLYSADFAQAGTWPVTRCTIGSNAALAPDGTQTADSIISSADSNTHYVEQSVSAAASEHVFSVWAKAGAVSWIELSAPSVSQAYAYFDLSGGVVGNKGSGAVTSGIEAWGSGWYRCWFTYAGGAASHAHRIGPAEADGDDSFAGDAASASIYVWGAQHEDEGSVIPSSYIPTTTGAATRTKDSLSRTISGMSTGKFSVSARVLTGPTHNNTQIKQIAGLEYDDNNRINASITAADVANAIVVAAGSTTANVTGATDLTDGAGWRDVKCTARSTNVKLLVDGASEGVPDTSATMPTAPTSLKIGCSLAALTGQPLALIREIKVQKDIL